MKFQSGSYNVSLSNFWLAMLENDEKLPPMKIRCGDLSWRIETTVKTLSHPFWSKVNSDMQSLSQTGMIAAASQIYHITFLAIYSLLSNNANATVTPTSIGQVESPNSALHHVQRSLTNACSGGGSQRSPALQISESNARMPNLVRIAQID